MKKIVIFLAALTILFSGCNATKSIATIQRQVLYKDKNGAIEPTLFTVNTDATQRFSIIMANKDGKFLTFAENPPDAAVQSALGLLGKADVDGKTAGKVSTEAKLDFAKTIAELGKRSEAVNFQRDGLFRLSEMFNNGAITPAQLIILVDSLQRRTVQIANFSSNVEKENLKLAKLKELNSLLARSDSTSKKLTIKEIEQLVSKL